MVIIKFNKDSIDISNVPDDEYDFTVPMNEDIGVDLNYDEDDDNIDYDIYPPIPVSFIFIIAVICSVLLFLLLYYKS